MLRSRALVVILEAVRRILVVGLRILRVLDLEEIVLVETIRPLERPDVRLVILAVQLIIIVGNWQRRLVERIGRC